MWLRRARAAHLGAGRVRPLRDRHRRLLPDRPDDPRDLARHRRLQRLPDAAVRPRPRATGPTSCATLFGVPRDALPELVPELGRDRHAPTRTSFLDLVAADRRDRRRPAVRAVRPDLLRRGRLEVHLRHRLVHPHQHRHDAPALRRRAALDRGLALARRRRSPTRSRARSSSPAPPCSGCATGCRSSARPPRPRRSRPPSTTPTAWSSCPRSPASAPRTGTRTPAA